MIKHFQRGKQDCFSTCIACILETDPAKVPDFCSIPGNWRPHVSNWLVSFGFCYVDVRIEMEGGLELLKEFGYHIISGRGPRRADHSVVGNGGVMVHDPWPDGGGLLGVPFDWQYGLFVSLDPSRRSDR